MSEESVDTALLDLDTEVLREVFDATGGRDKWILGVADFGARLQPPPPPPDRAPALAARLEDEKEPLARAASFLGYQPFEANVPEALAVEKYREAPGEPLKERAVKYVYMAIEPPNPLPADSLGWLQNDDVGKWFGVKTNHDPTWHFDATGARLHRRYADGDAVRIAQLNLDRNNLVGAVPSSLGRLDALQELSLSGNALAGAIPPALGGCAGLRVLRLSHNALTGPIPPALGACGLLEELRLGHNRLTGALSPELARLSALRVLDARANGPALGGAIPDALAEGLACLRVLDLADNGFFAPPLAGANAGAEPPALSCAVFGLLCRLE